MTAKKYTRWSRTDDALLRRLFSNHPTKQIAEALGRPATAVSVRASNLGLKKSAAYRRTPASGCFIKGQAINGKAWTPAQIELLRKHYPDTRTRELVILCGHSVSSIWGTANKLGLKKSKDAIARFAREEMLDPNHKGRHYFFPKGHAPANKGTRRPGWAPGRMADTWFKKGNRSLRWKDDYPVGSLRLNTDGYVDMKVSEGLRAWRQFHRILWEDAHGPIPKGHILIFKDGDRLNIELANLEMITLRENMRRNTIHNYPAPLKLTIMALGQLKRRINEKQNRGSAQSPV